MEDIYFTVNGIRNSVGLQYKEMKASLGKWSSNKTCPVMTINDILNSKFKCVAACRFTCGYRARIGTYDYNNKFNKTVLIDFDYKNVIERPGATDPNIVFYNLLTGLRANSSTFYYFENSLHTDKFGRHDSAHLLFYYKDITVDNYEQYYKHAVNQVVGELIKMYGEKPKWVYDVIDKQCANPSHIIFITGINAFLNPNCTGDINIDELPKKTEPQQYAPVRSLADKYETVENIGASTEHLGRGQRWKLYANLYFAYNGDLKRLNDKWACVMSNMEPRKHDAKYYISEPVKCRWNESVGKLTSIDKYLLLKYGVIVV